MIVTIWRHGQAGSAVSDRLRELTDTGRADLALGGPAFRRACEPRALPLPSRLLHSAWLRTTQTAALVEQALGTGDVSADDALLPGAGVGGVDACLERQFQSQAAPDHLLLVSHQPLVSRLVDHYLGERGRVPPLSPGGLATLSLDAPAAACAWLLFWALPPTYEVCA